MKDDYNKFNQLVEGQTKLIKIVFIMAFIKAILLLSTLLFINSTYNILKYNQELMGKMQPEQIIQYINKSKCVDE